MAAPTTVIIDLFIQVIMKYLNNKQGIWNLNVQKAKQN